MRMRGHTNLAIATAGSHWNATIRFRIGPDFMEIPGLRAKDGLTSVRKIPIESH